MYLVSEAYANGLGVARDEQAARRYLRDAAEHGQVLAAARLGNDAAAESRAGEAARWLQHAIDGATKDAYFLPEVPTSYQGRQLALARYNLGLLRLDGNGIEKDDTQALALFRSASAHDCALATFQLARMSHEGIVVPRDDVAAVKLYEAAASAGIGSAAFDLAEGYMSGWAGERSVASALQWYRRSAALGLPDAWFALGRLYEEASGVPGDKDEALTWYQLAGNNKVTAAQIRLGDIARYGQLGQVRNDLVALRWYDLAADQGSSDADEKIGDLYWRGAADLPRNRAEAVRYYRVAADLGRASSARKLAIAYADGDGVPADDALMLQWEHKAAEAGDAVAAGMLGYAILIGIDGTYDVAEAAAWLTLSIEHSPPGDWRSHAAVYATDAQTRLTPPEREALRARLARWESTLDGE
jgi:TPR repeat protein